MLTQCSTSTPRNALSRRHSASISACGGVCACTTCHLWIKDQTGISPADDDELDRMDMAADQQLNSRLGCQAVITGPGEYVVEIPKWNRNYVSEGKPLVLAEEK